MYGLLEVNTCIHTYSMKTRKIPSNTVYVTLQDVFQGQLHLTFGFSLLLQGVEYYGAPVIKKYAAFLGHREHCFS